ncbi:hypothetical protein SDRG_05199 [Saprolegnia diclina VS20]|uniref:Uncharacterized protein n=1 Tax=Saprolegnia diclina (strain VS20) TaxID=1156394 RepID=T0QUC0_SAPDV|nr:hypothetical protein SDRG_05199 [Saprolegnia diclina VS20]EQC37605.1 hypothetical protein SDRG_05199 [Saprolegnia diclina VS20]|eukprot:XP_008609125.1 hypothetical protein SDRG_05199 [Saprolegnia diclina VS20]
MAATTEDTEARVGPVDDVNRSIEALDWSVLEAALKVPGNAGYPLCSMTEADFDVYIESENQDLKSRNLEWHHGVVYIVELNDVMHCRLAIGIDEAIFEATGTGCKHLRSCGSAYIDTTNAPITLPKLEPDGCFYPTRSIGPIKPNWLSWCENHTLKVEVGVHANWVTLDPKTERWCAFPGIRYVLCVHVSHDFAVREYKLFSITNNQLDGPAPHLTAPTPIHAHTRIELDGRRLLALPDDVPLPLGFNASIVFELNPIVQEVWCDYCDSDDPIPPPF